MTSARLYSVYASPVGPLTLSGDADALTGLAFGEVPAGRVRDDERFERERRQLDEYFRGVRSEFDLDLRLEGTPFQLRVWEALRAIPYGTTTSYGALARTLGSVSGARKVGAANGRNPIAIVVPCHRVIGVNGKLVGYGGGLERKRDLLALEGALLAV